MQVYIKGPTCTSLVAALKFFVCLNPGSDSLVVDQNDILFDESLAILITSFPARICKINVTTTLKM